MPAASGSSRAHKGQMMSKACKPMKGMKGEDMDADEKVRRPTKQKPSTHRGT